MLAERNRKKPAKPYQIIREENPEQYMQMMEAKRIKISESVKKKWQDPEYRARMKEGNARQRKYSPRTIAPETRRKLAAAAKLRHAQDPLSFGKLRPDKSKAAMSTAQELMSDLFVTKQRAHELVQNIQRLEEFKVHLRNDKTKLKLAEQSLTKAKTVLQSLKTAEESIKNNIRKVIGQQGMQDIEEIIADKLAVAEKESDEKNRGNPASGNGADVSGSKTFQVSAGAMVRSGYTDGVRRDNGGPEVF
eukprot:TRINITY_DN3295_c0_g1_i2.p1 TRINITY_DN3295_c0_g1~~TRINITY_DN3295_c0_g1_i2.p1  ORF type:complete len:248 (-),score=33.39 TRINITY_DN3295_c0_g1_i2:229-972(-)